MCFVQYTHQMGCITRRADAMDCEFIATGHYAIIKTYNDRLYISKGKDDRKDQSYVLWGLSQSVLQRSNFPLGQYTKPEIRQMAKSLAIKKHSQRKLRAMRFALYPIMITEDF